MKLYRITKGVALCAGLLAMLTGCKAEYETDYKRVYFDQAANSSINKLAVEIGEETKTTLTVRLVEPQAEPVTVTIAPDEAMIADYNQKFGAGYEMLPADKATYETKITLPAGQTVVSIPVTFLPIEGNTLYALPLRITQVEGPVTASSASSKLLYLLDKPIIQATPEMVSASHPATESIRDTSKAWNQTVDNWSLECWVWMSGFNMNNQAIFNFNASAEIYIRFGDAPIAWNSLQVKYQGTQNNTAFLFADKKWNHLAFVYSTAGKLTLYVNGQPDFTMDCNGGPVTFNGMEIISSGTYFVDNCRMGQIRLWKKALSGTEVAANMYSVTNPNDANLMGYWRMDEGEGLVFKDSTPNGRDMTAAGNVTWIPNTRFDGK